MRTSLKQNLLVAAIAVACGVLLLLVFAKSNTAHAQFTCSDGTHTVEAMDTMWQIASENCEGNLQNAVYHMVQMNDGRAMIQIGQVVAIPAGPTR
jgi:TRAP-type C4-dicarboxylate transport system substrate-binding protein